MESWSSRAEKKMRRLFPVSRFLLPVSCYPLPDSFLSRIDARPTFVVAAKCSIPLLRAGERWQSRFSPSDFTPFLARIVDVRKMLHGLLKKLRGTGNGKQEAGNG